MHRRRFLRSRTGEEVVILARRDYDELLARARRLPGKDEQISQIVREIAEQHSHGRDRMRASRVAGDAELAPRFIRPLPPRQSRLSK